MKFLTAFLLICVMAAPAFAQQPGWIGITIEDGKDQGASIQTVQANSPAEKAGLKTGDLVLEYNRTRDKKEQDISIDRTPSTR